MCDKDFLGWFQVLPKLQKDKKIEVREHFYFFNLYINYLTEKSLAIMLIINVGRPILNNILAHCLEGVKI